MSRFFFDWGEGGVEKIQYNILDSINFSEIVELFDGI